MLTLFIETYGLFGSWTVPTSSASVPTTRESLKQLILKGAFKQLDLDVLFNKTSPGRFGPKDKRALAVKLGFCLMDFFDSEVSSRNIYFLSSSNSGLQVDFPYLAFDSKQSTADKIHDFQIGDPALLSFAKLLLEMEFGQSIDLDIAPQSSQNQDAWLQLLIRVDRLTEERSDSYIEAIRGCLLVHHHIMIALRSRNLDSNGAESIIRETLYEEVVIKLERGLAESIPRLDRKRPRSDSPAPLNRAHDPVEDLFDMTERSDLPAESACVLKRQRGSALHQLELPSIYGSSIGEGRSRTERMPAEFPVKRLLTCPVSSWDKASLSETPRLRYALCTKGTEHKFAASNL